MFEKIPIGPDTPKDEILGSLLENRLPLLSIGLQQGIAAPAIDARGKLPAKIGNVVEPVVESIAAIGRVAVGGITRNEDAADLISLGDRDCHVPKSDIVKFARELEAGSTLHQPVKVIVVPGRILRDRSMEEKALFGIDPAEEPPIALELRIHRTIGRARRKAFEAVVQLA